MTFMRALTVLTVYRYCGMDRLDTLLILDTLCSDIKSTKHTRSISFTAPSLPLPCQYSQKAAHSVSLELAVLYATKWPQQPSGLFRTVYDAQVRPQELQKMPEPYPVLSFQCVGGLRLLVHIRSSSRQTVKLHSPCPSVPLALTLPRSPACSHLRTSLGGTHLRHRQAPGWVQIASSREQVSHRGCDDGHLSRHLPQRGHPQS